MFSKLLSTLCSALVCIFSLLATASLAQTTINVGPGQPHTTIQSGIDAAANGDTVLVAPGTYNEHIDFKGKLITVTSSGGASVTTIDGGHAAGLATVFISGQQTSANGISGFTIRGGGDTIFSGTSDGGIEVFSDNPYVAGPAPTIENNVITANYCHALDIEFASPTIRDNVISNTVASPSNSGAPESYCGTADAIYLGGTSNFQVGGTTVIGNTIENNSAGGSAIQVWAAQKVLVMNNVIRNNYSRSTGSAFLSVNVSDGAVVQNLIYGNTSTCGGAISFNGPILVANNTLADNLYVDLFSGSECTAISQIFPGNYEYGESSPSSVVINNIISGSTPYPAVNCDQLARGAPTEADQPTFQNNILYNAGGPFFGNFCVDVSSKYNNIVADAQFVSPSTGDYHLKTTSPAIDSGQNTVLQTFQAMTGRAFSTDFDGKPRVQGTAAKGCTIDMGAYESPGTQSSCFTTETLTSSLNPSSSGQTVTFTAQLSSTSGVPTGDVQFSDGSTVLGIEAISATGASTFSTGQLTIGSHPITATYQPTGSFAAATANLTQVVSGYSTTTTLTCSPTSITIGGTALLNAAVTSNGGTPTGSLTFTDNGIALTTQSLLNGAASFTYAGSTAGTHTLIATYVPTGAFTASTATCSVTVNLNATTTSIASSLNPSSASQSVTFTATVHYATAPLSPPGAGSVTFSFNGTPAGTASLVATADPLVYTATVVTQTLPSGSNIITAALNPPILYASSSASLTQVVNALPSTSVLTITPAAATFGTPITLTATVSGAPPVIAGAPAPTGTVTFRAGATLLGTAALNTAGTFSTAVLNTAQLPVGGDQISCTYSGDTIYLPSLCNSVPVTISSGTSALTITSSQNPSPAYTPVTFTIHLTLNNQPAPAGTQFTFSLMSNSGNVLLTTDANGNATYTTSQLFARTWDTVAIFSSTNYVTAITHYSQVVTAVATTLSLTASPNPAYIGQAVRLAASTTPSGTTFPTGTVTFLEGATVLGTGVLNSAGQASFSISTLAVGTHTIIATYPGDSGFLNSTSQTISVLVLPQGFTLSLSGPTLSIASGHYKPFSASVQSFGGFTGSVQLTCAAPQNVYLTCDVSNAQLQLAADSSVTSAITMDTNVLLRFEASLESGPRHTAFGSRTIAFALLLPLPLGFLVRRRLRALPLMLLLFALGATLSLTGCGNKYPAQTPPGVYDIVVNATGTSTGSTAAVTQTVHMQLTVTPK